MRMWGQRGESVGESRTRRGQAGREGRGKGGRRGRGAEGRGKRAERERVVPVNKLLWSLEWPSPSGRCVARDW